MFVKQIDMNEALRLAAKGKEIKVLVPPAPGEGWNSLVPDTLQDMLEGVLFFRDEPAMVKPVFEADGEDICLTKAPQRRYCNQQHRQRRV